MALTAPVKSHHTAWVRGPMRRARPVRYAVEDDRLVCFGDRELAEVPDGTRVTVTIHEIAGGPPLVEFGATLHDVDGSEVPASALTELLDHVSLGHDAEEVEASLRRQRHRRLVELAS